MYLGIIGWYNKDCFAAAAARGFKAMEFDINDNCNIPDFIEKIPETKELMARYGVGVCAVGQWGTTRLLPDASVNFEQLELEKQLMKGASELGCPVYITGCNRSEQDLDTDIKGAIDYIGRLVEYGKEIGVKVCLYNCDWNNFLDHGEPMAKVLAKKLEEFDPMFIEEPVLCENMEVFKEIAACCNVPIATGERLFTKYDFKRLLEAGGVDIIQPDLSHAGGITEVKKIGAMAESYDVALAPHCPLGPIALAACLNVDAISYNGVIQEQSIGIHYNVGKSVLDYVHNQDDFRFIDGYADLPKLPGLGVDVNKELVLEENKTPHNWKNPVWHHEDGSVAEW